MDDMIMIYSIEKGNDAKRFRFSRALFPYKVQSHSGKYNRETKGILKEYTKLSNSVILFDKKYYKDVISLVRELGITAQFFIIKEKL